MKKSFSHLIWLGAGQAKEPAGLISQAKQVTLVDARESACEYLKKQFPSDHVHVTPKVLTASGGQQNFTEYNLPEYSALQTATGIKKLFPGLKIAHQETTNSTSLEQFFKELNLTDSKNALVVDLPDVNQAFLEALHKTGELYKFNKLYIFASPEPLYLDALSASAIVSFLQSVGYLLLETLSQDPDFPCLVFAVNPLWVELQQANYLNTKLVSDTKELQTQQEMLKQQLVELKQQADLVVKERETLKQQLVEIKQQVDLVAKERDALKQQLVQQQQTKEITDKELQSQKQQLVEVKQQADQVAKERDALKQQLVQQQQTKEITDKELQSQKQQLVEVKQQTDQVVKERDALKQQLVRQQQTKETTDKELQFHKQQLVEAKQQADLVAKECDALKLQTEEMKKKIDDLVREREQYRKLDQEQTQQIGKLKADLEQMTKHATVRLNKITQIEKGNRLLQDSNAELQKRQRVLEQEIIKAEAQITFIKDFLLKN